MNVMNLSLWTEKINRANVDLLYSYKYLIRLKIAN